MLSKLCIMDNMITTHKANHLFNIAYLDGNKIISLTLGKGSLCTDERQGQEPGLNLHNHIIYACCSPCCTCWSGWPSSSPTSMLTLISSRKWILVTMNPMAIKRGRRTLDAQASLKRKARVGGKPRDPPTNTVVRSRSIFLVNLFYRTWALHTLAYVARLPCLCSTIVLSMYEWGLL